METKEIYVKPEMECVELEASVVIASSLTTNETSDNTPARSKRRDFWRSDNED